MSFAGWLVRAVLAVHALGHGVEASHLRQGKTTELSELEKMQPSELFSAVAQSVMQNMTKNLVEFQQVVVQHSTRFETILLQEEKANAGIAAASAQIASSNQKLEVGNGELEKQAATLIANNTELQSNLKGLEKKLRVAQMMAVTVSSFHADGADNDENVGTETLSPDGDVAVSLLVIGTRTVVGTRTSLSGGVKALADKELDEVAQVQKSGEKAFAEAKRQHMELIREQTQLNATHASSETKKSKLIASIASLTGKHTRLQSRYQSLLSMFMQLAGVASGR